MQHLAKQANLSPMKKIYSQLKKTLSEEMVPQINLKKKFPQYFNLWIFRIGWVLMALLLVSEYVANDNSFTSIYVTCDADQCINPFYLCSNYDWKDVSLFEERTCQSVNNFCPEDMCYKKYLARGETYGRQGAGWNEILLILLGILLVNHVWYILNKRSGLLKEVK